MAAAGIAVLVLGDVKIATRSLLHSIRYLGKAAGNFADNLVAGLSATSRGPDIVESGLMLVTALAPEIGYDNAAKIAKHAHKHGKTLREAGLELGLVDEETFDRVVKPETMVGR